MAYTYYEIHAFSGGTYDGEIGVEVASQSVSGNYSNVNLVIRVRRTSSSASSYNLTGSASEYIKVDGTSKVTDNMVDFRTFDLNVWYTILSVSNVRINHTSDGTKTALIQGYCATGVSAGTYNQTASVTLPAIPRKSTASVTSSVEVNGTNQCTATITRYDASFTHTVTFYIGDFATTTYKQEYTSVATSQAYAIPLTWMNAIPNSTSGSAKVRVETFDGATSLGYNEYTFAITVPSTVIPVVTDITFSKASDVFSAGIYAKGISKLSVSAVSVTNQYSATTSSYLYGIHLSTEAETTGQQFSQSAVALTSDFLQIAGTNKISVKTTDSRTRQSAYYGETFTVYDYSAPSLTVTGERCTSAGVVDPNGDYIKLRIQATVSAVGNDNTADYTLEFKKTTDSSWTSVDVTALADDYSVDSSYVRSASASYSWEVRASVVDKVNTVTKTAQVATASSVMDFLAGGTGMAIGKVAESTGLEIAWEIYGAGLNLTEIPLSFNSTAAAATADKGTFDGHVFLSSVIDLILDNGNTASSPTIAIGSVTYSISGMPTVAKLSSSTNQTYKLKKTAATTLTMVSYPDYVCEYGATGQWKYRRWVSGVSEAWGINTSLTIANAAAFGTGGLYTLYGEGTIPTGLFNATPVIAGAYFYRAASIAGTTIYAVSSTAFGCYGLRNSNASTAVTANLYAIGTWK